MKLFISVSSPKKITADLLVKTQTGTYHGGMQKVSSVDGRDILWNFVAVKEGKTQAVMTREEAVAIVANGKVYKF